MYHSTQTSQICSVCAKLPADGASAPPAMLFFNTTILIIQKMLIFDAVALVLHCYKDLVPTAG